jgi:NADH-quinone oxidoreductase subunit E
MRDAEDDTTIGIGGWGLVVLAAVVTFSVLHFGLRYHLFPAAAFAVAIALIVLLILYRLAAVVNRYDDAEASRQVRKIVPAASMDGGTRVSGIEGAQASTVVAVPVRPETGVTPQRPSSVVTPLAKVQPAPILPPQPVAQPVAKAEPPAAPVSQTAALAAKISAAKAAPASPPAAAAPPVAKPKAAPAPKASPEPKTAPAVKDAVNPKAEFKSKAELTAKAAKAAPVPPKAAPVPPKAAPGDAKPKAEAKPKPEAKLKVQAKPAPEAKPAAKPVAEPKLAVAAKPEAKAAPKSKVAKAKPLGLIRLKAPLGGKADDLKLIDGVGPALEKLVNSLGFYHFNQIAAWTEADVALVDAELKSFKGRVTRDKWVVQAQILANGGTVEEAAAAAKA